MTEYDAFGRKQGENPLEQLGSGAAPPPGPPGSRISTPPPAKRSSALPLGAVAIAVVVLAVTGAVGWLVASGPLGGMGEAVVTPVPGGAAQAPTAPPSGQEAPPAGQEAPPTGQEAPPTGQEAPPTGQEAPAAARPAVGLQPGSLLRRQELERALTALRAGELGSPVSFRLAADRIDVQVKTRDGRLRNVQVSGGKGPRELSTSPPGFGHVPAFEWRAVDPAAPQRFIRAAAERSGRSAADVDYLVLMSLPEPTWGLFFKGGMHFQADAKGKILRRVS